MMDWLDILFLLAVGMFSGALNSMAGGGSFFSFPVLLSVGLPPVTAQVTNHLGLMPANMMALLPFLRRIKTLKKPLLRAIIWCGCAGIAGGLSLILFPPTVFENIVPYLILAATLLYWAEPRFKKRLNALAENHARHSLLLVRSLQMLVAFYCGYFGAGVGFLFLAAFALDGFDEMVDIQCMKNTVISCITFIVLLIFIWHGSISWYHGIALFCGAAIGGLCGGQLIAHLPPLLLRSLIIAVGFALFIGYSLVYIIL